MRVLITGGAGFIGSHLVDHCVSRGDDVVILDDFSTGRASNLEDLPPGSVRVLEGQVEDELVLAEAADGADLIFHLAAAVGVFEILEHPLHALRSNLAASDALFSFASSRGIRTVFTSTSEVYGKNNADGLRETDDSVFGPTSVSRWLYGMSKATDEFMALAHHAEDGLPVSIARLFNTTGPRQSGAYGMVVPRLIGQALSGEPLTVYGGGHQTRCFTNVFDVVEALSRIAATDEAIGEVINVGRPVEIAINDLAELIRSTCGSESPIEHVDYADAYGPGFEDMRRRVPNVDKLRELTGFAPETRLEVTVQEIIEWMTAREARGEPHSAAC